jgi:hypothetical protein
VQPLHEPGLDLVIGQVGMPPTKLLARERLAGAEEVLREAEPVRRGLELAIPAPIVS